MEMEIRRIDHLGIVAGMIKELGIIGKIDKALGKEEGEVVSSGETVAAVIFNGLGFVNRALMLTPQFFETKALEVLLRPGIAPEHLNRHKIGRVLDNIAAYGPERLFTEVSLQACIQQQVKMDRCSVDTTTYSLSGEYDVESDTERIRVAHGYSKDKRPDLKQLVQELMVSQDGGIPLLCKTWDGNASDSIILRERAKMVIAEFAKTGSRCLLADCKLYSEKTAPDLNKINFITRVPAALAEEGITIQRALQNAESWHMIDENYKVQEFESTCYNIQDQRWIVVYSEHARTRAIKTLNQKAAKELAVLEKELFHLQAQRFSCTEDARMALAKISKKLRFHTVTETQLNALPIHVGRGRPKKDATPQGTLYQLVATATLHQSSIAAEIDQCSCFVLATNLSRKVAPMATILADYKGQDKVEKGFGFLKSPEFFASSLYLKSPERIDALLMIMVLALLIYSLAQRNLRASLAAAGATLPNQIKKPTKTPTMRWIFQQFEGIDYVTFTIHSITQSVIKGVTAIRKHILSFMCKGIQDVYQFSPTGP